MDWGDARESLHQRYDGPIPAEERAAARHRLDTPAEADQLAGRRLMWASYLRAHLRRIRKERRIPGTAAHIAALTAQIRPLMLEFRGANRAYWDQVRRR